MKTKAKKQTVKIFGQEVTVGTKKHKIMLEQQKIFIQNGYC